MTQKQDLWRKKVLTWLEDNVSTHRLEHILGVEATCIRLAQHYRLPARKAAKAGLLHDLAKFFPPRKLLKIASKFQLKVDPICKQYPHLLHADISAIVARQKFGIKNSQVLEAIANHTLGNPKMSALSCLLYVADAIEPNRGNTPELNHLRSVATTNLYRAVWETSDCTIQYLLRNLKVIHPRTVATRNWALSKAKKLVTSN